MSLHSGDGEEGEIKEPAHNDTLTHVLFAQENVGDDKKDSTIIDVMVEQFKNENIGNIQPNAAIAALGANRIKQIVLGPNHVGVLLNDSNVCRIPYNVLKVESSDIKETEATRNEATRASRSDDPYSRAAEVEIIPLSGGLNSIRTASGATKYRRVMLSNRAYYRLRGNLGEARSYILGSSRSVVPAANVPEELINNVQQVLQGKSREAIIRELQRTSLNVNEAVNNLLSRDEGDDGDAMDIGGEHMIPEELLQILEGGVPPGSGSGSSSLAESFLERVAEDRLLDSLSSRTDLRYHFGSSSKKPKTGEKDKKKKESEQNFKNCIQLGTDIEWWRGEPGEGIPAHAITDPCVEHEDNKADPIVGITGTSYQLYVLHANGQIYSWPWKETTGADEPLDLVSSRDYDDYSHVGTQEDPAVRMSCSNLRVAALTRRGHLVTWFDECGAGARLAHASETVSKIPEESVIKVQDLVTSDHLAAFRIDSIVHWCGVVPLSESKTAEKEKADRERKKHVSFNEAAVPSASTSAPTEFVVGQLVQMKKAPLYPAGSVAAQINTIKPMIGVLTEDCWNQTDHCRFRTFTPEEYDMEQEVEGFCDSHGSPIDQEMEEPDDAASEVSRKRSLDDDPPVFGSRRDEVWHAENLVWIHEHRKRDVLSVEVVDNNLVAVKSIPPTGQRPPYQSIYSDRLDMIKLPEKFVSKEATEANKIRLMRKDDLQIIDKGPPRVPVILQKDILKFDVDSHRTIVSMVADLNEFRVLARSKHVERGMHMYRVGTSGKVISRRRVPVFLPAVERPISGGLPPQLISFGDARTLFLRDTAGQLIPLQRDALNGFREPPPMHSQPILHIATAWRPVYNVLASCEKNPQWLGAMLVIPGVNRPFNNKIIKDGSALMQLVLYCDSDGVNLFLDRLQEMRINGTISHHDFRQTMNEQLFAISSDLCSNVLHAAIRLCIANKNSEEADKANPDAAHPAPFPVKNVPLPAVAQDVVMEDPDEPGTSADTDEKGGRWGRVLRNRPNRSSATPVKRAKRAEKRQGSDDTEDPSSENVSFSSLRSDESGMPFGSPRPPEHRQKAALSIVDTLLKHPAMFYDKNALEDVEYLDEVDRLSTIKALLQSRDLLGMTPFQSAINQRAYGAANSVWRALLQLKFVSMSEEEKLKYIFPSFTTDDSHNADDSPLFILCYNDVCSFTWTGEDHINQDIYECKTCGLTGSLCCCSECALTCHRNHDCRLKRTSPTAYCDCWEKSSCKALVAGNERLREHLLNELLKYTNLYEFPNARNEHIILFLSRTVIRQTREQTYSQKKRSRYRGAVQPPQSVGMPEHNLQPPKFAKSALDQCCRNVNVVMHAIKQGHSKYGQVSAATPGELHFLHQSSASHLDKLSFALSNKVLKEYSDSFINSLRQLLTNGAVSQDSVADDVEVWVTRFVRSLVRVLTLSINVSPLAPNTILASEEPVESPRDPREPRDPRDFRDHRDDRIRFNPTGHPPTIQVFSSLLASKKENSKMSEKSAAFVAMINRIMQFLQQLPTFAVVQLAIAADAVFEPVRDGMVRPMVNPSQNGNNHDPMETLEKYFSTDLSFSEILKKAKKEEKAAQSAKIELKRTRRNSRRDTDRGEPPADVNRESGEDERSAGDRVSESQEMNRVRTESTATVATPRRRRLLSGNTTNDDNEDNEERTGNRPAYDESSSADDNDEDDDDDVDDEDEDNEKDDNDNDNDDDDDDDDDDDSDRPAEERPNEVEDAEEPSVEVEQEDVGEPLRAVEEDEQREPDRDEEVDWQYEPGSPSPRPADFDDGSSDSQEGARNVPAFQEDDPLHNLQETLRRETAEEAANAMSSLSAIRERALAEYEANRRATVRTGISRISDYYPQFRGRATQRDGPVIQEVPAAGGSASAAAASSSAPASASNATAPAAATAPRPVVTVSSRTTPATAASGTTAPAASQESSPGSASKKQESTEEPTLEAAREVLALTFSILVRAGCDILSRMPRPVQSVYTKADDNAKITQMKAQRLFGEILSDTFRWMGRVFESTEAKINFNETYERTLVRPVDTLVDDKKGKRDAMSYLSSLLRSATNEAKDASAFIDVEMLYPVALVADSYFHFLNCNVSRPIELKQIIDFYEDSHRRTFREKCEQTDEHLIIGFFARPQSLCWPGYLLDGAWDTISGRYHMERTLTIEEECPMIGAPKVLTMQSKSYDLFRDPVLDEAKRSTSFYEKFQDPVEQYVIHISDRPYEYRLPGSSMSIVPHRDALERDFISMTRDFYRTVRTPDEESREFPHDNQTKYRGYIGQHETALARLKKQILEYSCEKEKIYFSKWFKTLNIISNHFYDKITDVLGGDSAYENSVILQRLATFETKHKLFNKATEKYRTQHSNVKEITLDVRRESGSLFRDTMVQFHHLYMKRMLSVRTLDTAHTPLAGTRLRVHFIDEPGEGTGVTRSFYTAFAESCMADVAPFSTDSSSEKNSLVQSVLFPNNDFEHDVEVSKTVRKARREQALRLRTHLHRLKTFRLNLSAPRFDIKNFTGEGNWTKRVLQDNSAESQPVAPLNWGEHEATLRKIHDMTCEFVSEDKIVGRVMGMMCQLQGQEFRKAVDNDDTMRLHVQQILAELRAENEFDDGPFPKVFRGMTSADVRSEEEQWKMVLGSDAPMEALFEKSPYGECYVPNVGNGSPIRMAAFRTIGRIMGICLSQGDIFPMRFARHVFAYILKEPICWLDLGFYDPVLFNNLRLMLTNDFEKNEMESDFTILESVAGGKKVTVGLRPNADQILVTKENVHEFVYKYAERVLIGRRAVAFEALREGVLDVIPESILNGLTPEDLRLIICGIESVSINILQENTSFLDESRASQETLNRFKQWFWQVIESFTPQEKQDLVFFWTGSPSLPAAGKWQSSATVMLRPQEDVFLPTANTCISRIYVPVYSTKRILKSKLLMAIKAKNFGFV